MCVLCGELVMKVHWTDQKTHNQEFGSTVVVGESQRNRMRSRLKRVYFANQILSYYGLQLNDWNGSKYILRDKKGNSIVVQDLGDMWPAAEKLAHCKLDPLDHGLLDELDNSFGDRENEREN